MKNRFEGVYFKLIEATAFASVAMLVAVVLFLLYFGWDVFSAGFFTDSWNHQDISSAGIFQAIFGTLVLVIGVFVVSVPIGISSAIYLTEYARSSWGVRLIRLAIRNLAGVPSIVYGLFGLVLFVQFFSFGPSLVAAVLTLALMTLPWNISASEEAIKTVPSSYREAALALGANKWQTVRYVIVPESLSGMLTGVVLGVSRAAGETAPLILVGATFFMNGLPQGAFDSFMALPYHLFILATQHADPLAKNYAAATAVVLMALMLFVNGAIFFYRHKVRRKALVEKNEL